MVTEEHLTGFPWDVTNHFQYSRIKLNLPGSKGYSPGQPWFSIVALDDTLVSSLAIYVDDERIHSPTCELVCLSARQVV